MRNHIDDAGGFSWLQVAGKILTEWLFIDMDDILITAYSLKEGAVPHLEEGLRSIRWEHGAPTCASPWTCSGAWQRGIEHLRRS